MKIHLSKVLAAGLAFGILAAAVPARADRDWDRHEHRRWHRGYAEPGVVYAPPVVYEPPPEPAGINLVIPVHIR